MWRGTQERRELDQINNKMEGETEDGRKQQLFKARGQQVNVESPWDIKQRAKERLDEWNQRKRRDQTEVKEVEEEAAASSTVTPMLSTPS